MITGPVHRVSTKVEFNFTAYHWWRRRRPLAGGNLFGAKQSSQICQKVTYTGSRRCLREQETPNRTDKKRGDAQPLHKQQDSNSNREQKEKGNGNPHPHHPFRRK